MRLVFLILILVILGGLAWIRLAPSDPEVWHVDPQVTADQDLASGVRRRIVLGSVFRQQSNGFGNGGRPEVGRLTRWVVIGAPAALIFTLKIS